MSLSPHAAKEFLIRRILVEADLQGIQLSEVERKMLHFTETDGLSPEMAKINEAFERDYNEVEYEDKIEALIRNILKSSNEDHTQWHEAVQTLSQEDHYLLLLIAAANRSPSLITFDPPRIRPPHDRLKLIAIAALLVALFTIAAFLSNH